MKRTAAQIAADVLAKDAKCKCPATSVKDKKKKAVIEKVAALDPRHVNRLFVQSDKIDPQRLLMRELKAIVRGATTPGRYLFR